MNRPSIQLGFRKKSFYPAYSLRLGALRKTLDRYDNSLLSTLGEQGVPVERTHESIEIAVTLNITHGNPGLVRQLGVGPIALDLAAEPQYKIDEQDRQSVAERTFSASVQRFSRIRTVAWMVQL